MGVISSVVAGTIGTAVLLAGAGTVVASSGASAKEERKKIKNVTADAKAKAKEDQERIARLPGEAAEKAKEDIKRRRRTIARTGGKTILASRFGGNVDPQKATLLGE